MAKSTGQTATYQVLSAPAPHPTLPNWRQFDALLNGHPVVVEYRVPLESDEVFDNPLLREVFDMPEPDLSTTWGRICAHLRATAGGSALGRGIPLLGTVGA